MRTKNSLLLGAILLATMGLGTWFSLRRDVSKSDDFHEREIHQEQAGDALVAGDAPANADTVPDSEAAFQLNDPRHLALPSALVGLKVLQERKEAHPGGGIRRVRLLEDPENEPNPIRLEEVLLQEADGSWLRRGFEAMVANRVLVGSEDPAWLEAFSRIQPEGLFAIERKLPHSPVWLVRINQLDIDAVPEALSRLKPLLGTVGYVEPDHLNFPLLLPDDTLWSSLWAMPKIDAPTAWDTTTGDPGVVVAVLDTGTRITHEELRNTVWVNHREIPGNGIDDDYNGYIDDLNGWNVDDDNGDLSDVSGHGTHVSGTMAAEGNNGTGVAGVAWGHKLMVMAAGSGFSTSETAEALDYMVFMKTHRGVNVVASNHSYGSLHTDSTYAGSSTRRAAIARARDAGILFIAAGGNDGKKLEGTSDVDGDGTWYNHYPSSQSVLDYPHTGDWDSVIAVAASTSSDDVAGFSNWGLDRGDGTMVIDLTAPGVGIRSTAMGSDSSYGNKQGTSMASPHVTGAAGLVASANSSLGAAQLKDILMASVDAASAWSTRCESGGRLNVGTAVATAQTYPEVAISNLQDGHYVEAGTPLLVEVDASDSQGSIVGVSLYREGDTNPLAVDSDGSDGWQLTWASVPAGNHTLYATATNSAGKTSIPDRRVRNIFTGEAIATSQDGFYPGSYWYFSSGSGWSGVYGTQLRYFDLLAEETQTYVIPVYTPQGGNYEVFAWWPGTWTKTLADSVPISVPAPLRHGLRWWSTSRRIPANGSVWGHSHFRANRKFPLPSAPPTPRPVKRLSPMPYALSTGVP
jgi:subtilisin family serine protease